MTPALAAEIMRDLYERVVIPFRRVLDRESSTYGVENMVVDLAFIAERWGYSVLGSGHFSAVVAHVDHPEYAFKLGFRAEDSGAMYAAWCRDTKLPHLPEIIHMHNYPEAYMVCMPKYGDSCSGDRDIGEMRDLSDVLSCMVHGATEFDGWVDPTAWHKVAGTPLHDTLLAIHKFFNGMAQFDLHRHNWMWDKNGRVVITDPVSFQRKNLKAPSDRLRGSRSSVAKHRLTLLEEERKNIRQLIPDQFKVFSPTEVRAMRSHERHKLNVPRQLRWEPLGNMGTRAIDAPRGVVKNGSTLHLQVLKARPKNEPSGFFVKLFNRIREEVL